MQDAPYAFKATYEEALQRSDDWRERVESAVQRSDGATFFVFVDGLPVGMVALLRITARFDTGERMQVWVSPDHRGTGVARDLVDAIFTWAGENHFEQIIAGVTKVNARALTFYTRYGFAGMDESAQSDPDSVYLVKEVT